MFCCFRPSAKEHDVHTADTALTGQGHGLGDVSQLDADKAATPSRRLPGGSTIAAQQPAARSASAGQQQMERPAAAELSGAAAMQAASSAPDLTAVTTPAGSTAADDAQGGVLKLVALLQELLALSTVSPRQPLSRAMALLLVRLPVDWACLHAISNSGSVVLQVGSALSPEALRQRGASGSCSHAYHPATPVLSTPGRHRYSGQQLQGSQVSTLSSTPATAGTAGLGVQEMGAGQLQELLGSGGSLEIVAGSRQALAMYAGNEIEAARLPRDWQRLHKDRDLRSFLAVPIIASGSSGCIIGALSFGLTSIQDWGSAWWMSSIQLLCGWAAGALPQNRATYRAGFFDALWNTRDLDSLGAVFVHQLPHALVDQAANKLEVRVALVSSRLANCVIYATADSDSQQQAKQQQSAGIHQPQQHQQQQRQQSRGSNTSKQEYASVPEGVILACNADNSVVGGQRTRMHSSATVDAGKAGGMAAGSQQQQAAQTGAMEDQSTAAEVQQQQQQQQHQHEDASAAAAEPVHEPVARFSLPTANSVLLSALEWGEVMVVKDTVTYFGRNAGGAAVRDLFLPDRQMVRGTLVLLPLLYRCRPLGCVYLLAPWDIHAVLSKAALQEMAALLAAGTFKALLSGGQLQQEWYSQVLSEGPLPVVQSQQQAGGGAGDDTPQQQQQQQGATNTALSAAAAAPQESSCNVGNESRDAVYTTCRSESEPATQISNSLDSSSGFAAAAAAAPLSGARIPKTAAAGSSQVPLGTAAAAAVAPVDAAAAAAAAAATTTAAAGGVVPVGLAVSGHACSAFPELVLWPEMLDVKEDLARSRHTAVYTAEHSGHTLAIKLFRYSSSMDHGHQPPHTTTAVAPAAALGSVLGHSGTSGSSSTREAELESVLSLQYRLCSLQHEHILQHVAVYPRVFEVVQRRSSREPPDVYITTLLPRKERHHRCTALVTEYAAGGCLRDAVTRGALHVPTATALRAAAAAAGIDPGQDLSTLDTQQLQLLLVQLEQQLPLLQVPIPQQPLRMSAESPHMAASLPGGLTAAAASIALSGRMSNEQQIERLREPFLPLLQQLLLQVALGMQHLHANGIIHGELRLDNVMIAGAVPPVIQLIQQQQFRGTAAMTTGDQSQQQQQRGELSGSATASSDLGEQVFRAASSSSSTLENAPSVSSQPLVSYGSCNSIGSCGSSSSSISCGFVLKLKDIGLCTLGWSQKQVTLRKLAGRPRLQAVSWLAPECFRGEGLSKHSDVYAFGILMWELYTGQVAFNDLVTGSSKVLQTIINDGVRPQFPDGAPSWFVTLASRCWSGTAKNRPGFRRIVAQLQALDKTTLAPVPPPQQAQQQSQQQEQQLNGQQ